MADYRQSENRAEYFSKLYRMNLEHGVMPGLVYLYMPALADRYNWDSEQRLWFAFLNGMTQNPITSLQLFKRLPEVPPAGSALTGFEAWFNENWAALQFDTDRLKNKRNTVEAVKSYANLVSEAGSQTALYAEKTYAEAWETASRVYSFGRLSTFSYLEYVYLNGLGPDCDNLMFEDKSGSRSHRNGMFFLIGKDELVWDKRLMNGQDGCYNNFKPMCKWLSSEAEKYLETFKKANPEVKDISNFTLESQLCQFKNGFFRRRFPGVYSDLAWERIEWADERGLSQVTSVFKEIRAGMLPDWLRIEAEKKPLSRPKRASMFADTGIPFRGEYFL